MKMMFKQFVNENGLYQGENIDIMSHLDAIRSFIQQFVTAGVTGRGYNAVNQQVYGIEFNLNRLKEHFANVMRSGERISPGVVRDATGQITLNLQKIKSQNNIETPNEVEAAIKQLSNLSDGYASYYGSHLKGYNPL